MTHYLHLYTGCFTGYGETFSLITLQWVALVKLCAHAQGSTGNLFTDTGYFQSTFCFIKITDIEWKGVVF